ncbi:hypothetical protein AGMMS49975_22200 [Clostridia bacterium]|nr:hypothetical protein AGMMS49975_22200 [Clostridia bacterium]
MNDLTKRLLAEGCSPDKHPDYVYWDSGWKEFSYTYQHRMGIIWQAPCGVFKKGGYAHGWGSYMGIDYRTENNNPRFGCPYPERPCEHRSGEPFFDGENCVFHETMEPYDYENSLEKARDDDGKARHAALETLRQETPGAYSCYNLHWDSRKKAFEKRFDIENCARSNCQNTVCAITRKPLDPAPTYIEYDILRIWHTRLGLIEETRREITKGLRVFKNSCGKTVAELWIKTLSDTHSAQITPEERQYFYHEEIRRQHPDISPFYPNYDEYDFSATAQNMRTKPKGKNARDLAQDLADISEGIIVIHESDKAKAAAQAKRERRETRRKQHRRRLERLILEKGFDGLEGLDQHRARKLGDDAIQALERRRCATKPTQDRPIEQLSLFELQ